MKKLLLSLLLSAFGALAGLFAYNATAADIDTTPDCDTVAIIKCGAFSGNELRNDFDKNAYGDLGKVYGAFGISRADLNGGFVDGIVWRDGRVTVDGRVVANNARTAGRWYNPTSDMTRIAGTDRAYKMSTSHFVNAGQTALLKFNKDGKFLFAVIKSCGNPVVATPVVPKYTCDSLSKDKITRNKFEFTAKASHNQLADVREYEFRFGDGESERKTVKTSAEKTTVTHAYDKPGTYTVRVKVTFKVFTDGELKTVTSDNCVTTVTVSPPPVFTCDELSKKFVSRYEREFTVNTTAKNGASVVKYVFRFGDGSDPVTVNTSKQTATVKHTYANAGTYTAMVTTTFKVNGETKVVVGDNCKIPVTVNDEPVYTCDGLTKKLISRTEREFTATASGANGAVLKGFRYDFGDGTSANDTDGTVRHNFVNPGNYTVVATAIFDVKGETKEATSPACQTVVTVVPPETHPGVKIDKKVNGVELTEVAVGEDFTYQIRVTNTGDVDLKDVYVSDPAPAGVTMIAASEGAIVSNKWSYVIPSLAVGQHMDFTITAKVVVETEGEIVNTACVDAPEVNPNKPGQSDDCDDARVKVKKPHVRIDKKVNGVENTTVAVDEVFTYQVRVTNDGAVALKNVVVSDPAPAGVTMIAASLGSVSNNVWTYTIPALAVGEHMDFTITAKYPAYVAGTQVNIACVNAPEVNPSHPEKADDCDDASTQVKENKIPVCDLTTGAVIMIDEKDFDSSKHSKNLNDCDDIVVCELATTNIITINKFEFDQSKYSLDLKDCDETVVPVCDLTTGEIVIIKEDDFDSETQSKNLSLCKDIVVCKVSTKEYVTIKEYEFDASVYSRNLDDCVETPVVPPTPTPQPPKVLPTTIVATGPEAALSGLFGSSALSYGAYSFFSSRRALKNKLK